MKATKGTFGPLTYVIVALTILTAVIHLTLNFPDPLFIVNGLGYIGLLGALYLQLPILYRYRGQVRWVFIAYTALTVTLWLFISPSSPLIGPLALDTGTVVAYVDKIAEVLLIISLWVDGQR